MISQFQTKLIIVFVPQAKAEVNGRSYVKIGLFFKFNNRIEANIHNEGAIDENF